MAIVYDSLQIPKRNEWSKKNVAVEMQANPQLN